MKGRFRPGDPIQVANRGRILFGVYLGRKGATHSRVTVTDHKGKHTYNAPNLTIEHRGENTDALREIAAQQQDIKERANRLYGRNY